MSSNVPAMATQAVAPNAVVEVGRLESQDRPRRRLAGIGTERLMSALSPIILLAAWEVSARLGVVDTRFFPAPSSILQVFWQMLQPTDQYPFGELWYQLSASLSRIVLGFLIGAVPGVIIGLAMGLFRPVRAAIQPLIDATFPIPKIAVLPLFIMIFGIGEQSKYAIIATAVIYLVLINTVSGVRNIDQIYLDVGKNFHANGWMMFRDVALPGALPLVLTGLKLGMGVALLVIVAAEQVAAKSGLGYMIWTSWQVFQVEKMYVGLLVIAVVGFGTALLLSWLERRLVPWKHL